MINGFQPVTAQYLAYFIKRADKQLNYYTTKIYVLVVTVEQILY